jgi:hypothetical protein
MFVAHRHRLELSTEIGGNGCCALDHPAGVQIASQACEPVWPSRSSLAILGRSRFFERRNPRLDILQFDTFDGVSDDRLSRP